ncbi:hypothetical protein EGR_06503 [Echinococcus granulosus]|uniref:Uncharacterized protein n=1 Tax=Echinococcus granulosus TaxID=6210 RepID=W6UBW8_ECHGR|nr:hypothetical protein EGR_06503 [Echinococcus granulosus]EUB58620.1 hypothetical protein EGR_06503 [Echinococcus granulosus]
MCLFVSHPSVLNKRTTSLLVFLLFNEAGLTYPPIQKKSLSPHLLETPHVCQLFTWMWLKISEYLRYAQLVFINHSKNQPIQHFSTDATTTYSALNHLVFIRYPSSIHPPIHNSSISPLNNSSMIFLFIPEPSIYLTLSSRPFPSCECSLHHTSYMDGREAIPSA